MDFYPAVASGPHNGLNATALVVFAVVRRI